MPQPQIQPRRIVELLSGNWIGYPFDLASYQGHVAALSNVLAQVGASTRTGIEVAGKAGDADTADLFTEVSRGIDKLLWMVEAHSMSID